MLHSSTAFTYSNTENIFNTNNILTWFPQAIDRPFHGQVCELFSSVSATSSPNQILSLLESMSCSSSSFTEVFDKMFSVAAAKGELEVLVTRICNVILAQSSEILGASSTTTTTSSPADAPDEQTRIALFDVSCLLLIRCCMMFGSHIVPQSVPFCRWLGSHVCGPYNPLQPLLPLIQPTPHPPTHRDNVDMLVRFFSSDCKLDTSSLQNVITAIPDALGDIISGFKSEVSGDLLYGLGIVGRFHLDILNHLFILSP